MHVRFTAAGIAVSHATSDADRRESFTRGSDVGHVFAAHHRRLSRTPPIRLTQGHTQPSTTNLWVSLGQLRLRNRLAMRAYQRSPAIHKNAAPARGHRPPQRYFTRTQPGGATGVGTMVPPPATRMHARHAPLGFHETMRIDRCALPACPRPPLPSPRVAHSKVPKFIDPAVAV